MPIASKNLDDKPSISRNFAKQDTSHTIGEPPISNRQLINTHELNALNKRHNFFKKEELTELSKNV